MQLTNEQRVLLEGDAQRAQRNLPLMGWSDATTAPDWAKERILEIRSAIVEKRSVPAPSGRYIAAAERRSLTAIGHTAIDFGRKLFKPTHTVSELEWQKTVQQALRTQATLNAKAEERQVEAARTEEAIADMHAELFPWERS